MHVPARTCDRTRQQPAAASRAIAPALGDPARFATQADRNEFGKRMAVSNLPLAELCLLRSRIDRQDCVRIHGVCSRNIGATAGTAATVNDASG